MMGEKNKPKKEKVKKQSKVRLFIVLILISIVPLILSMTIISVVSSYMVKGSLESNSKDTLYIVANNLANYCKENEVNAINASGYYNFLDSLQERGIEMAVIAEGMPCATSIKNENDYRVRDIELSDDPQKLSAGYFDESIIIDGKEYCGYYLPIEMNGQIEAMAFAGELRSTVTGAATSMVTIFALMAIILVAVFVCADLVISRGLSLALTSLDENINTLARGNLSSQKYRKAYVKEMNNLVQATTAMQQNLSNIIGNVKGVSQKLVADIGEVTELSDNSAGRAKHITSSMDRMSASSAKMDENVQDINLQMHEIESCVNDISESVEHLYRHSENLLQTNSEATKSMELIMESSERSVDAVTDISQQINETNTSINEIDKAVELIIAISEQTNLLSLNASIEAARAGESGKGFAVVAEEIRKLSEQSAEGAEMIKTLSKTIGEKSAKSVELVGNLRERINEEQKSVTSTKETFEKHSTDIKRSVNEIESIAGKTEYLTNYKNNVIDNVQALGGISEETASSSQEVSANIEQIINGVEEVNEHCEKMNSMAFELQESVAYFHDRQ